MVTEVMDTRDIELIEKYTDIFQVGARNIVHVVGELPGIRYIHYAAARFGTLVR